MPGSRVSTSLLTYTRQRGAGGEDPIQRTAVFRHDLAFPLRSHRLGPGAALELFGFEYKIEVYTPAARRRYGYYSLPILHNGALVGRLDAKAHRKQGTFEVKAIHLEPDAQINDASSPALLMLCEIVPAGTVRRRCWSAGRILRNSQRRSGSRSMTAPYRPPQIREDNLATTNSASSSSGPAESDDGNQAVCAYTSMA